MDRKPARPKNLDPIAVDLLDELRRQPEADQFILGGYFALAHYLDYRATHDVDAWWSSTATEAERKAAMVSLRFAGNRVAQKHGLGLRERMTLASGVHALEFQREGKTVFSFQIAPRDRELEQPYTSPWTPIKIETLADNIGSKMNALVERGAPRDIRDVHALVANGISTTKELWDIWQHKNPGIRVEEARLEALRHLESIELRRPLESLSGSEKEDARTIRNWFRMELVGDLRAALGHEQDVEELRDELEDRQ